MKLIIRFLCYQVVRRGKKRPQKEQRPWSLCDLLLASSGGVEQLKASSMKENGIKNGLSTSETVLNEFLADT